RWGLIPHWMKARPEITPINARAETVADKRMFADAYAKRRCIVPMDAFYERDKRKKLHAFAMTDGTPFGVAGLWENWRNQDGAWERTFCIITVPANELVGTVHDRMPAIIPVAQHPRWLGTEPDPRDLLRPFPAALIRKIRSPRCTIGVAGSLPGRRRNKRDGRRLAMALRRRRRQVGASMCSAPMRANGSRKEPSPSATNR